MTQMSQIASEQSKQAALAQAAWLAQTTRRLYERFDPGDEMAFTVIWLRGPLVMGSEPFDDLETATAHADDQLAQMHTRFGATAVKIVDEAGNPHYLKSISR